MFAKKTNLETLRFCILPKLSNILSLPRDAPMIASRRREPEGGIGSGEDCSWLGDNDSYVIRIADRERQKRA